MRASYVLTLADGRWITIRLERLTATLWRSEIPQGGSLRWGYWLRCGLGEALAAACISVEAQTSSSVVRCETRDHPGNELTTTPRGMLSAVAAEVIIQSDNLHTAVREHGPELTNDARQSAGELLQQLEKAAEDLGSLLCQEESHAQPENTDAINRHPLVRGFLLLPSLKQLSVMESLGFPDARDRVCVKEELGRRFFGWVRDNKLIDRLQAEIGKASP
jgi:hypothetical protein